MYLYVWLWTQTYSRICQNTFPTKPPNIFTILLFITEYELSREDRYILIDQNDQKDQETVSFPCKIVLHERCDLQCNYQHIYKHRTNKNGYFQDLPGYAVEKLGNQCILYAIDSTSDIVEVVEFCICADNLKEILNYLSDIFLESWNTKGSISV